MDFGGGEVWVNQGLAGGALRIFLALFRVQGLGCQGLRIFRKRAPPFKVPVVCRLCRV